MAEAAKKPGAAAANAAKATTLKEKAKAESIKKIADMQKEHYSNMLAMKKEHDTNQSAYRKEHEKQMSSNRKEHETLMSKHAKSVMMPMDQG